MTSTRQVDLEYRRSKASSAAQLAIMVMMMQLEIV
jgi:hypothetical protein